MRIDLFLGQNKCEKSRFEFARSGFFDCINKSKEVDLKPDWVVRHGLRGLLKKGNGEALWHFGFEKGQSAGVVFFAFDAMKKCRSERRATFFTFDLKNEGQDRLRLRLEYAMTSLEENKL